MNKCHLLKELSSYLDNELKEARKLEIEEHLKACKICNEELSRLKALSEKIKSWQVPELDAGFDASVRSEIVAQELERGAVKMKSKTLAILVPSGVLAGLLVFLFVGQAYLRHSSQGTLIEKPGEIGQQYYLGSLEKKYPIVVKDGVTYGAAARVANIEVRGAFEPNSSVSYADFSLHDKDIASGKVYNMAWRAAGNATVASAPVTQGYQGADTQAYQGSVIVIQPVLPATGEGEKIIRTAEVRLEVEDGKEAYKKASQICQELGGYLAASNFYKDAEGREAGTITMRIPKDKFTTALDRLSALGKVENSSTNSQDVSQEYANLKTQLDTSMIVYNKMLEALQKRQVTIPEAMKLESELTPVLRQVEDLKNKLEALNNAVSFTTITVYFHEPQVSVKVLKETTRKYIQQSILTAKINAVKFFANIIPAVIPAVVWLVIIAGIVLLLKYWIIRLFKRG